MTSRIFLAAVLGSCLAAIPAWAQTTPSPATATGGTTDGTTTGDATSGTTTGGAPGAGTTTSSATAFDKLSPGNQKIARSLFDAQGIAPAAAARPSSASGSAALSLDDIAALRSGTGWGQVFKQMQAQGQIDAKNLGEVVSGRYQPATTIGSTGTTAGASGAPTGTTATDTSSTGSTAIPVGPVVTSASGRSYSRHGTTITTGSGRAVTISSMSNGSMSSNGAGPGAKNHLSGSGGGAARGGLHAGHRHGAGAGAASRHGGGASSSARAAGSPARGPK